MEVMANHIPALGMITNNFMYAQGQYSDVKTI